MSSTTVQAAFSTLTPLRPFQGFEAEYQGEDGLRPVLFPGGRSEFAGGGTNGFDGDLAASLPVPFGARAFVYLPVLAGSPLYAWTFSWQVQPAEVGVAKTRPHHMGGAGFGTPDVAVPLAQQKRFPILAAVSSVGYEQAEPATATAARLRLYQEAVTPRSAGGALRGLLPGGSDAVMQQGILPPLILSPLAYRQASFVAHAIDCLGDSLIVEARKATLDDSPPAPWDFAPGGEDYEFAQAFGASTFGAVTNARYPYSAIFVATGSNP